MKYRLILIITLLIFAGSVFAQYDERAIMTQNAQQFYMRRQYADAEQAWLQLLQKYPNDANAVSQLFNLYLQISQPEKADKLLQDYKSVLPDNLSMEYEIQLDINQAKINDAWDKVEAYIDLNPNDENRYRILAGYFVMKGFNEQAIRLYEQGRKALNRNDLFCMEIGNTAYNSQLYDKAMTEYVRFLEVQPGNVYFVSNQVKNILNENPELITQLRTMAKSSTSSDVKEVYAIALSRMGRLSEALSEYEQLPTEKLYAFANEQYTAGKDSLAILAYNTLRSRQVDTTTLGEILLRTAECNIRLRQFAEAESILVQIVNPVSKQVNQQFTRRRYPFLAYIILSDLAQWQGRDVNAITGLLNEARKLAISTDDVAEADYRLIGIYYVSEQYAQAEALLSRQNDLKQKDRQLFYQYLITMGKPEPVKADSLLNELVITSPSSRYVNDLMTMNILLMNLKPNAQSSFLSAYRYRLSHRDSLAIQTVFDLSVTEKDEELRVLAADWAMVSGFRNWAEGIYDYDWQDELLKEYALLQKSRLQSREAIAESMAQDFLKSNPNSVFSPNFRQILQKAPTSKRSL
jgi:tetratricopeptide (TPR) repeat protein